MPVREPDSSPSWFDGSGLSSDEAALAEAVRRHLAAETALTARELAERPDVREHAAAVVGEPMDVDETWSLLDEMLEHLDAGIEWLADERNFLAEEVCAGAVVTVRVTEDLLGDGDVHDGPDVALLALTGRREFPVATGGLVKRTAPMLDDSPDLWDFRFVLPPGAVPPDAALGDLLALSWDGQRLSLALVDEPPSDRVRAAADALAGAFEHLMQHGHVGDEDTIEAHDLLGVARIDNRVFDEPVLPVTELLGRAGLSCYGDNIARADHDWASWREQRRIDAGLFQVGLRFGLGREETMVALRVLAAAEWELAALDEDAAAALGLDDEPPVDDEELPLLLAACSHPPITAAVVTAGAHEQPEIARGLLALAQRLQRVARGRQQAVAHHLAGVAAEAAGEVEQTARNATLAVRCDPRHTGAAQLAARLASLQGRAGEALRALGGAFELDEDSHLVSLLRRHSEPGPTDAPRNAPCPCGSGRKHKVCCGPSDGWPVAERVGWLLVKLRDYATGPLCGGEAEELVETLAGALTGEVREEMLEYALENAFVHGLLLWEGGALSDFLDLYAPLLPAEELEMARGWQDAALELWEVTEVRAGEGLSLLGLYRGQTTEVRERAFSHQATVGQTVLARVLDCHDHRELQAVWPVDLRLREYLLTEVFPRDPDAFEWAAVLAPRPMQLANHDGEPFAHHTVRYRPDVDRETTTPTLDRLFGPAEDGRWAWMDPADPALVVRAFVELDGDELVAVTNSDARRERLDAVLRDGFGDDLREASATTETLEDLRARATAGPDGVDPGQDVPPEAYEALEEMLREAEERWVDEPVPALGGATPREALKDPTRRGELLALLDEFEREQPLPGTARTFDVDRLRRLLDLAP